MNGAQRTPRERYFPIDAEPRILETLVLSVDGKVSSAEGGDELLWPEPSLETVKEIQLSGLKGAATQALAHFHQRPLELLLSVKNPLLKRYELYLRKPLSEVGDELMILPTALSSTFATTEVHVDIQLVEESAHELTTRSVRRFSIGVPTHLATFPKLPVPDDQFTKLYGRSAVFHIGASGTSELSTGDTSALEKSVAEFYVLHVRESIFNDLDVHPKKYRVALLACAMSIARDMVHQVSKGSYNENEEKYKKGTVGAFLRAVAASAEVTVEELLKLPKENPFLLESKLEHFCGLGGVL